MLADRVNKKLNCIRLKSYRHGAENEGRETYKVFSVCTLHSVRGQGHILRSNALFILLHYTVPYKYALNDHLSMTTEWLSDLYYMNMSFRNFDYRFKVRRDREMLLTRSVKEIRSCTT